MAGAEGGGAYLVRPRAHSNPLYSGWRAENVIFGTQPGVALNRRRAILLKK